MVGTGTSFAGRAARRWPGVAEWAAAAALTAFVVVLHVRHFTRAGPLWRDEISTVEIATRPTVAGWYHDKVNDSAPMLWDAVVRAWTAAGPGASDRGLRVLGLGVGVGIVAALWVNARLFGARSPVASLVLLGLNGLAVCYGDSLRAYGPGMLAGLLCTGAMFHLARADGRRRTAVAFAGALVAVLASVQVNFFDTAWVLAACLGGAAVCGAHGRWGRAAGILAIGAAGAASLAMYANVMRARAGLGQFFAYETSLSRVVGALGVALGRTPLATVDSVGPAWAVAVAAAVVVGGGGWLAGRRDRSPAAARRSDAALFSLVTLTTGLAAYVGVLWALGDSLAWFHYLVLFALVATCVDGLLAAVVRPGRRAVIAGLACGVGMAWAGDAWRSAGVRMSNVDRLAGRLASLARPGDLVVVDPWWMGCALARYYRGPGDLVTVPPVSDLRFQRFDLVVPRFADPHAIDPVLERLAATARAGHRVWVVMHPLFTLSADPTSPLPRPAADWNEVDYYALWTRQLALALQRDFGARRVTVLIDGDDDVSPYENLRLLEPTR